jgi:hypothetical protein
MRTDRNDKKKFYKELIESLRQAQDIYKGNLSLTKVDGMPAETYRVVEKYPDQRGNLNDQTDDMGRNM